jgi:hypothetical protein
MNIHYRIVKADPAAHGILIRYWTDKVTEMDLASQFDANGNPVLNSDGYPVSTRTDSFMSIYETPAPSNEVLIKRIIAQAPTDWLKLQEDIADASVDTKMADVKMIVGDAGSFTEEDITREKEEILAAMKAAAANNTPAITPETRQAEAYDVVNTITDAIVTLKQIDPQAISEFANTLSGIVS